MIDSNDKTGEQRFENKNIRRMENINQSEVRNSVQKKIPRFVFVSIYIKLNFFERLFNHLLSLIRKIQISVVLIYFHLMFIVLIFFVHGNRNTVTDYGVVFRSITNILNILKKIKK